ncbi:hypothetical protein D3C71_1264090 [compost metagenome]
MHEPQVPGTFILALRYRIQQQVEVLPQGQPGQLPEQASLCHRRRTVVAEGEQARRVQLCRP